MVDINLRSPESVQLVRNRLRADAYSSMPRLFVLAEALHHASMQAWALGATDTIARPLEPGAVLQRIRAAFPDTVGYDASARGKALNRGVEAAHEVIIEDLPALAGRRALEAGRHRAGRDEDPQGDQAFLLREWLTAVGCHHETSYRHCLFVTGFAVAFAQHLGMREDDQRRLTRAALLHDVGKAFVPVAILDKQGKLTEEEVAEVRSHPRRGYDALKAQGGFPPEMLDVVLHHHELLDGSGYPEGLSGIGDLRHRAAHHHRRHLCGAGGEARLPHAVHPRQGLLDHGRHGRQARPAIAAGVPPRRVRVLLISSSSLRGAIATKQSIVPHADDWIASLCGSQ